MANKKWDDVKRSLAIKQFSGKKFSLYRHSETKLESDRQFKEYKMPENVCYRRVKLHGFYLIYIGKK